MLFYGVPYNPLEYSPLKSIHLTARFDVYLETARERMFDVLIPNDSNGKIIALKNESGNGYA